ncbi:substrate-binding periplasmic protein [Pseudoalteromonas ardens]|nr:transporter substrate-binding domain-containing protein [Pseudoalteromonas sp. R96]MDK1310764.1 transporter substrate-binding domain-containing protein [Pseudoalteromonas sp. R96]
MLRIILFCLSVFSIEVFSSNDKLVLIAGDNWCPVNCRDSDKNKGFMIDVATEALAISGYEVRYIEMPWLRAIHQAREGKIHAIVGAFKDDAPDFLFPKVPILRLSPNTLFTLSDNTWTYKNQHSLNKVRLGAVQGYDYGHLLNAYIKSHRSSPNKYITLITGDDVVARSLRLLTSKRIDAYVDAGPVVWYQAKQLGISDKIKSVGSVSPLEPAYIAFSPRLENSEQLTLALDLGVLRLQLDGRLASIAEKYGLRDEHYR